MVETHRLWLASLWNSLSLWWKMRVFYEQKQCHSKPQMLPPSEIFVHPNTSQLSFLIFFSRHNLNLDANVIFPTISLCIINAHFFKYGEKAKCNQQTLAKMNDRNSSKLCFQVECANTSCSLTDTINRNTEKENSFWNVINDCGR